MAHGVYGGPEGGPPSLGNILGTRPCGMSTKWPKRHTAGSGLAQEEPRVVNPGRKSQPYIAHEQSAGNVLGCRV